MTIAEVNTMLKSIDGFSSKVVYWAWPESKAPALPFICFYTPEDNNFSADDSVYYSASRFFIELYSKYKDPTTEALVEQKLTDSGIFYTKTSQYLSDEKCFITAFEIEV